MHSSCLHNNQRGGGGAQRINNDLCPPKVSEVQQSGDRPAISMMPGIPEYSQSSKPYQCSKCNALSLTPGYGRIVGNSVILDPIRLKRPKEFNIEAFMYFVKHKCVGLAHVEVSYCHGCKGALTVYSTCYQPSFISSVVRAFLITHGHLDLPTGGKGKIITSHRHKPFEHYVFFSLYIHIYIYICVSMEHSVVCIRISKKRLVYLRIRINYILCLQFY